MKQLTKRNAGPGARLSAQNGRRDCISDPWPSPQWKQAFRRRLLSWFDRNARTLPWRATREAYPIWISEIMLQQTQVATVIPYFERFLGRFPTLTALAAAGEQDVLRLWEGLGYYRRARQLHEAARRIVANHGGVFPADADAVRRLPGIGRYTAGAILSLAFDARQPILEANTLRLFTRLLAFRNDPLSGAGQKLLWNAAEAILPTRECGRVNQSLMELGSQVCTPRAPRCCDCPVASLCSSHRAGIQSAIPPPKRKPKVEQVREATAVVHRRDRVLLVQRAVGDRWAGLWDFPRFAVEESAAAARRQLAARIAETCSLQIRFAEPARPIATLRHGVTRFRITLDVYAASLTPHSRNMTQRIKQPHFARQRWVRPSELGRYPLSTTARKIAKLVTSGMKVKLASS